MNGRRLHHTCCMWLACRRFCFSLNVLFCLSAGQVDAACSGQGTVCYCHFIPPSQPEACVIHLHQRDVVSLFEWKQSLWSDRKRLNGEMEEGGMFCKNSQLDEWNHWRTFCLLSVVTLLVKLLSPSLYFFHVKWVLFCFHLFGVCPQLPSPLAAAHRTSSWGFFCNCYACFPAGGVLLPGGVSDSDGGGGDAHQAGSRQGRAGEVSAIQRRLQRSQERKGRVY